MQISESNKQELDFKTWSSLVAKEIKKHPYIKLGKWKESKWNKLHKEGLTVMQSVNLYILNY
jgi:hypothetical protein